MKKLCIILTIILIFSVSTASAKTLDKEKSKTADAIAEICTENWEEYGVLPSVAVAQAFIESTLGEHCSGFNLWGIRSGAEQYSSLEEGAFRYLAVINNGYYDKALFQMDYRKQMKEILNGGYCQPVGDYYENAIWSIEEYNFDRYDMKLSRKLKKQNQKKEFTLIHDDSIPVGTVAIDKKIVKSGSVQIRELCGFYDVIQGGKGFKIKMNNPKADGMKIHLDVFEDAVG